MNNFPLEYFVPNGGSDRLQAFRGLTSHMFKYNGNKG